MNPLTANPAIAIQHVWDTPRATRPDFRRRPGRDDRAIIVARRARLALERAGI